MPQEEIEKMRTGYFGYWGSVGLFFTISVGIRAWFGFEYLGDIIATCIAGGCLGLLGAGLIFARSFRK
jgi:hypothetical protein